MSTKRRKRAARQRRMRRISLITTLVVLALALIGAALWVAFNLMPGLTLRRYPMEYEPLVRSSAAQNGIEPAYVASVILAESDYDPQAVSSVGARGLMQIMPETGEWIAGRLDETFDPEALFEPETNVRYGCWYLGYLMRRFGGDMRLASSAYHAGQGNVDKWLQNPEYSSDGVTLNVIPYDSTNTYVQRILKYYEKYSKLYAEA